MAGSLGGLRTASLASLLSWLIHRGVSSAVRSRAGSGCCCVCVPFHTCVSFTEGTPGSEVLSRHCSCVYTSCVRLCVRVCVCGVSLCGCGVGVSVHGASNLPEVPLVPLHTLLSHAAGLCLESPMALELLLLCASPTPFPLESQVGLLPASGIIRRRLSSPQSLQALQVVSD